MYSPSKQWDILRPYIYRHYPFTLHQQRPVQCITVSSLIPSQACLGSPQCFPRNVSFPLMQKQPTFPLDLIPTVSGYSLPSFTHSAPSVFPTVDLPTSAPFTYTPTLLSLNTLPCHLLQFISSPFLSVLIKSYLMTSKSVLIFSPVRLLSFYNHSFLHSILFLR